MAADLARRDPVPLEVVPVAPPSDGPATPFRFAIAMGVRAGHVDLRDRLDRAIVRRRGEIDAVLRRFHVPGADAAEEPTARRRNWVCFRNTRAGAGAPAREVSSRRGQKL
jgi:hypothetical protein